MRVLTTGWNTFHETGKYTCAAFEYAGLASFAVLKKGGAVATGGVRRIASPIASVLWRPFGLIAGKTGRIFRSGAHAKKIRDLEEKLAVIEKRLASIEKHGVLPAAGDISAKKKKLTEDKRAVLRRIAQETKSLKEGE